MAERYTRTPGSSDGAGPGSAEELFADWIGRQSAGLAPDFEELCAKHPSERAELERMRAGWERLAPMLEVGDPARSAEVSPAPEPAIEEFLLALSGREASFHRYRIESELARGGIGRILRVWDRDVGRPMAMKVLRGNDLGERTESTRPADARALARFLEEARVTGQLDHPGIVPVHELGLDDLGRLYFTMRLVQGRDLARIFELVHEAREGWSQTRALGAVLKACEALSYAHARGVIHRDVKPSNIMVGRFGEVYVMDWGLARVLSRADPDDLRIRILPREPSENEPDERLPSEADVERVSPLVTMDGDVLGTASYMSPEQARGELAAIGPHSDVYSMGAILYHLLAGGPPYLPRGSRLAPLAVWRRVQEGPPARLNDVAPNAPPELVAICERAMAREPGERYRDLRELSEDLRSFLENRVVSAYETGAVAELRKWVRRNKPLALASAAGILILVAGLLVSSSLYVKSRANEARARTAEALAKRETDDVLSLSAIQELSELETRADALWPTYPDKIPEYDRWLSDAKVLIDGRPADPARGVEAHPSLSDHEAKLAEIRRRAKPNAAGAEAPIDGRRTFEFDDPKDRWWHEQLSQLVDRSKAFADEKTGLYSAGTSEHHGWGISRRREEAATIEARTVSRPEAKKRWDEAIASIQNRSRCPSYDGLVITPQLGLLPIGPDPQSGLWEFAHLQSGDAATRGADGKLALKEETGLVFVLIPGGSFEMGAQKTDPAGVHFDPEAHTDESPVKEVTLSPFFLSKFEMTQGQWLQCAGTNPSQYRPGEKFGDKVHDLLHPVELVSWGDCNEVVARMGLVLPTEAQWEFAARAGTATVWWTGAEKESVEGAANLADSFCKRNGGPSTWVYEDWLDDGYVVHAPVGTYRPNAFGLHDVIGNVWEWCGDAYGRYEVPVAPGDGARQVPNPRLRVARGGSFLGRAVRGRSASRNDSTGEIRSHDFGLRPARSLTGKSAP